MKPLPHFTMNPLPRGLALFLGGFSLLNLLGSFRSTRFDANLWWVDLHWLPQSLANGFLFLCGLCLVGFALKPPGPGWRRNLTLTCVALLGFASLLNVAGYYLLMARGTIAAGLPLPLSLLICAALSLIFIAGRQAPSTRSAAHPRFATLAVFLACSILFPLAQMFCFGKTDYRRPADVAVVLGARVYADGRLSDALADRVRTACQLYHDGLARKLLFSGGPGDGTIHETQAMRNTAIGLGVKPEDILIDEAGLNTQATARNGEVILARLQASRVLVVSHFYHLPRIKLAWQRDGWEVYTVPAKESYLLRQMPYNMAREVAALWWYYLRPLV